MSNLQATKSQIELGRALISGAIKDVTESANLTIDLAYSLFNSKSKYSARHQADSILWSMGSGDYAEQVDRNEYIHDLCVEYGGKAYTVLVDSKNGIKDGATTTADEPDYQSYIDQIKAAHNKMKDAVKCLAGFVFLKNEGNTDFKVIKSVSSVHKFVQCADVSGVYHKYNKTGLLKKAPASPTTDAQKRIKEQSNARTQGLLLAIVGINEAIRNEDRTLKDFSKFDSTERAALIRLNQDINVMLVDQESFIEEYMQDDKKITEALAKQTG